MEKEKKSPLIIQSLTVCLILFFILMFLKVFGAITLSWWWVTAPLWGTYGILIFWIVILYLIDKYFYR